MLFLAVLGSHNAVLCGDNCLGDGSYIVSSSRYRDVSWGDGVQSREWVLSVIQKEGDLLGGGLYRFVVCKFSGSEQVVPVVQAGADVIPQDLFDGAVGAFCLAVSLGVKGG